MPLELFSHSISLVLGSYPIRNARKTDGRKTVQTRFGLTAGERCVFKCFALNRGAQGAKKHTSTHLLTQISASFVTDRSLCLVAILVSKMDDGKENTPKSFSAFDSEGKTLNFEQSVHVLLYNCA